MSRPDNAPPVAATEGLRSRRSAPVLPAAHGFTLIELLVVLGILTAFLAMLVQFVDTGVRLFDDGEAGQALADRANAARVAVERQLRAITADSRRIEPGVPRDRLLVQLLPLGLPQRAQIGDPRTFVLRAGVTLDPVEEDKLQFEAMLVQAAKELGPGAERAAIGARAKELQRGLGRRGRGRVLLAQWPQPDSDDGALIELRAARFLEDQMLLVGDNLVDPFAVAVPGSSELPALLLHAQTEVVAQDLLYAEILMWSQHTTEWEARGQNGPEAVWDSARGGWLSEASSPPLFRLDRGPESLADPTDDVHPRAIRLLLVVAESQSRPREGLLADALEADGRTAQLVNGDRFPGAEDGGFVKIDGEWVRYSERSGDELRGLQRGQRGTRAVAHKASAVLRVGRTVQTTIRLPHGKDDWNG